jgi:hypothetical protein
VVGPLRPALAIEHLSITYGGSMNPAAAGTAKVTYEVANTGNEALAASQVVGVKSAFGTLATTRPHPIVNLVPGQTLRVTAELKGIPAVGPIDAHLTLAPVSPKGLTTDLTAKSTSAVAPVQNSASTWAIPWPQILLLAILLAVIWLWRRRRRRRGSRLDAAVAAALEQGRREATEDLVTAGGETESLATDDSPTSTAGPSSSETNDRSPDS